MVALLAAGCRVGHAPSPTEQPVASTEATEEAVAAPEAPDAPPRPRPDPTATADPLAAVEPAPAPITPCAPVIIVGARGSGQPVGAGAEVRDTAAQLTAIAGEGTVATEAVVYDASPIGVALFNPQAFAAGVAVAARALRAQTSALQQRCPDSRIVWMGFSQGALVVRDAMADIPEPAQAGVSAVVLMGDPDRAPGDPANRGTIPPTTGAPPGSRQRPLPPAWTPVSTTWCLQGDPFCDADAGDLGEGLALHAVGYREQGLTQQAAVELAGLLGLS
ncbi:cutinase Cut1 [soil metagenome]